MRPGGRWIVVAVGLSLAVLALTSSGASGRRRRSSPARSRVVVLAHVTQREASSRPRAVVGRAHVRVWLDGSWCWFADPRADHVGGPQGKTFVGWIDWRGHVTVGSYDPNSGVTHTHVVGTLFHDDHGSPAVLVEPDKRLTGFYSGHNGSRMSYRTTRHPENISSWGRTPHVRPTLP